ncbi:NADPH-dependent F420 reductase [Longispora albida]|uniref:NADPH-dependent F420 reductase n=1 Tax=Longispora albida TaxID=203523 RepID=UPI00037B5282|nr:NADPH-dependent F420 reductase [Longispora albida]
MRIGLIGTGRVGATLAGHLVGVGHQVILANSRGPQSLASWLRVLGPLTSADTVTGAAASAELVILAAPWREKTAVPAPASVDGKVVVDVMNAEPEDDLGGQASSAWTAQRLPGARVVKAFNALYWEHLRDQAGRPDRRMIPLCGDDQAAKETVAALIRQIGFAPVDTGDLLTGSRLQEPGGQLFQQDLTASGAAALLAPAA